MTEELNNFCTDLKDLFMQQNFPEMERLLSDRTDEDVAVMAMEEHDILAKYYEQEKYTMLLSHLNFVAFASYLFEYAGKRGAFTPAEFKQGFQVFLDIYALVQSTKQSAEESAKPQE